MAATVLRGPPRPSQQLAGRPETKALGLLPPQPRSEAASGDADGCLRWAGPGSPHVDLHMLAVDRGSG